LLRVLASARVRVPHLPRSRTPRTPGLPLHPSQHAPVPALRTLTPPAPHTPSPCAASSCARRHAAEPRCVATSACPASTPVPARSAPPLHSQPHSSACPPACPPALHRAPPSCAHSGRRSHALSFLARLPGPTSRLRVNAYCRSPSTSATPPVHACATASPCRLRTSCAAPSCRLGPLTPAPVARTASASHRLARLYPLPSANASARCRVPARLGLLPPAPLARRAAATRSLRRLPSRTPAPGSRAPPACAPPPLQRPAHAPPLGPPAHLGRLLWPRRAPLAREGRAPVLNRWRRG
jgi:hypothetical protein